MEDTVNIDPKLSTKSKGLPLMVGMAILAMLAAALQASAQKIITIDPPGAGTTAGLGTVGIHINQSGAVTGFFSDSEFVTHAFVRTPDGAITTFDAPGAGSDTIPGFVGGIPVAGILGGEGTYGASINRQGTIAGFYVDSSSVVHGFVRSKDGEFTTFDAPNAASTPGTGTYAANINDFGMVAGVYVDASGVVHSYIRTPNGSFLHFDPPGTGFGAGQGSFTGASSCLSPWGTIAGYYLDPGSVMHGYLRTIDGKITTFEVPGSGTAPYQGTYAWTLSPFGVAAGQWIDGNWVAHGFIRHINGRLTTFDHPGAGTGPGQGTVPNGINATDVVVGNFIDKGGLSHGFMRTFDGRFTAMDVSRAGTASGQGTYPVINNLSGATTGVYVDANGALHGFLWIPKSLCNEGPWPRW